MEVQLGVIRRRRIQLRLPRIVHEGGDGEGQGLLQLRRNGRADRGFARCQYLLQGRIRRGISHPARYITPIQPTRAGTSADSAPTCSSTSLLRAAKRTVPTTI